MERSLQQMYDITEDVKSLLTLENNTALSDNISFGIQADNFVQTMAKELNVNIEGRYLFGGTKTDLPPVIDEPIVPMPYEAGELDAGYYQGSEENVVTRIQDNIDLTYDVRADDEAFQQFFSAVRLAAEGHSEKNREKLAKAQTMIDQSLEGINELTAKVQSKRTNIDAIVTRQKDMKLYFSQVRGEVAGADTVEVASRVAIDQATLSATFQVFARISSLKLSDFL
jgi:flagellar hook-associated protein 3 FlgL